jgi:hypothetical protein
MTYILRTPEQEAKSAFKDGVKDAVNGRERKNASDRWGPYGHDYDQGFQLILNEVAKPTFKGVK